MPRLSRISAYGGAAAGFRARDIIRRVALRGLSDPGTAQHAPVMARQTPVMAQQMPGMARYTRETARQTPGTA